jgi:hypothetical protein
MENYFGKNGFVWFVGVVEDRMDPEKLGRVRVRALGHHTVDKAAIPTEDLPWSTVMSPTTNPSMDGLGTTPPFLVEGSWVSGFFLDKFKQDMVVVGTLPGFNTTLKTENKEYLKAQGFRDPTGNYPRNIEPDTNKLARGDFAEYHDSLLIRRMYRITDVPKATKAYVPTVGGTDGNNETRSSWDELPPKSNTYTKYPYNHVSESESGHVEEIDDTPGGERLMTYHRSGTFEEIHPNGDKVVKVIGSGFEITLEDKNVLIEGACNITISGDCRQLVKGDYTLEVEGDMSTKVHGSSYTKTGNNYFEIIGSKSSNINGSEYENIGGSSTVTTGSTFTMTNGGNHIVTAPRIDLN